MPKVFVHGNPECSAVWDLLVAELADGFCVFFVPCVGQALQEQHPEDVVLEFRGIHASPQDVCALPEERLQLGEGQFLTDLKGRFGVRSCR